MEIGSVHTATVTDKEKPSHTPAAYIFTSLNIDGILYSMEEITLISVLKALADPIRLVILSNFKSENPVLIADILTGCPRSQPTVSHHLGKLVEAGILIEEKNGTKKSLTLNTASLSSLGIDLPTLIKNLSVKELTHGTADY